MEKQKKWSHLIKNKLNINFNKKTKRQNIANNKATHIKRLPENQKSLEDFLRHGRQENLNLFKRCPIALLYTNVDGIIISANHYFEELTGFQEEELKGKTMNYCLQPEEPPFFDASNKTSFETIIYSKDHSRMEVLVRWAWNQVDNRYAGVILSFQDISNLNREQKMKQTLYRISEITHSNLPLAEIYPQVHEQLKNIIVATNFYIALWDDKQEQLFFPYYRDEAAGDDKIFILRYRSSHSIFRYVLKLGKPVLMDFQRYRKMLSYGYIEPWDVMTNTHLWLAVPLKQQQKVIGVIALQSYNNARLYREKDIDFLEFAAQQISTALYLQGGEYKKVENVEKGDKEKENLKIRDEKTEAP